MTFMTPRPISSDPPLPVRADETDEARDESRVHGALNLAIFALGLEILPAVLGATGARGIFAFQMMGIAGGLIAVAALARAFMTPSRVITARWAVALGIVGVVVWMYHPQVCATVANFLIAIGRGF